LWARSATAALSLGVVLWSTALTHGAAAQATAVPERGRETFTAKQCGRCHVPSGRQGLGPALESLRRPQGAYELAGRLWNHAPAMFTVLKQEEIAWPAISRDEMADLMAYLQADPSRDPVPDLAKGWLTLVSKGCLKCHRFRGEGGRLGPELEQRRADYTPASAWAAMMWRHTPSMAAVALRQGMPYPRFTGDEMVNLLGFLRAGPGTP
jgi:mono/diheme cytochrome c family protein